MKQRDIKTLTKMELNDICTSPLNYKQLATKYKLNIVYIGRICRGEPLNGY